MSYDTPTLTALASGALVLRDYLTVRAAATFAYWTGEDNVTVNVVPAGEVAAVARSYVGGGALLSVPEIVDAIGVEPKTVTFGLDHINVATGSPMDMVYGNDVRVARIELHRGLFDTSTWNLVAAPNLLFSGRMDGTDVEEAAAEGQGGLSLTAVNSAIDLTKTSPAMQSDEQQRLRSGDRFRRYGDTAGQVETWWGQAKEGDASSKAPPRSLSGGR